MRKIAISDIHGCRQTFEALLDKIALTTADDLYLLGDYIDRGPDSKGVLDVIFKLRESGHILHCLRGNHDQALLSVLVDWEFFSSWLTSWGGRQTLDSFGVMLPQYVPTKYLSFINDLEFFIEVDEYILVHAGLNFSLLDPLTIGEDLLFIRDWYKDINRDWLGERIIVHGHTPVSVGQTELFLKTLDKQRVIDIDNGCFADHLPGKGHLCAFDMTNRKLFFQKNLDDVSEYWASR